MRAAMTTTPDASGSSGDSRCGGRRKYARVSSDSARTAPNGGRRDDIDEGLQLVFGNGCGSKTRFTQRFINKLKAKSGDIGSKLKILQQIQNDKSNINAERTAFFIMA
ncbi:hypothetical protein F2P79_007419 [Pimephales promelas]|nr:hypothetical protein F2P79_007419 [Pimephales promelas]